MDRRTDCPICSSKRLQAKPFGYRFNNQWLGAVGCAECGIIFIDPQPTAEEIVQLYSKEYFDGDYRCGHAESYFDDSTAATIVDHDVLERISKLKPRGKFLEIGCAGGAFLDAARKIGYETFGVEFSKIGRAHV